MAAPNRLDSVRTQMRDSGNWYYWFLSYLPNRWVVRGLIIAVLLAVPLFTLANRDSIGATFWQHVGRYCGTLDYVPSGQNDAAAVTQVTSCFTHAYATCQAASLDFSDWFGDGGTHYVFIVEPPPLGLGGGNLALQETTYSPISRGSTGVMHCGGLDKVNGRLRFWVCWGKNMWGQDSEIWGPTP